MHINITSVYEDTGLPPLGWEDPVSNPVGLLLHHLDHFVSWKQLNELLAPATWLLGLPAVGTLSEAPCGD